MKLNIPEINLNKHQLFTTFVLFWVGLAWLGLALALLGTFYNVILASYFFIGTIFLVYLISFNKTKIEIHPHTKAPNNNAEISNSTPINDYTFGVGASHRFFLIFLVSLVAVFIFSFYTTPTIFSGRDQGSLSEAAIQLSQNHHLTFSFPAEKEFFKIYGPGEALNFPGFNYTPKGDLLTKFPLGYISWLATFYSIFGLNGFVVANSISFLIFLFSFYLVARYYLRSSSAITALALVLTSFIFSWFFKFTLSENLALMLTWFGIYTFVLFTKNKERFYLLAAISTFSLLLFSRIEALGFLAVIIAILLVKYKDWKYLLSIVIGKKILLSLGIFLLLYFFHLAIDTQSSMAIAKNILSPFTSLSRGLSSSSVSYIATTFYALKVLSFYSLLPFILFGILSFIHLWRHKNFEALVPFLIILPAFVYIIHPSISTDHPWMLRRFVFAVIPVSILYTVWFLDSCLPAGRGFFKKRIYFYIFSGLLIFSNLMLFVSYLAIVPNKNLLPQIENISKNFTASDLILVDRDATGDGWSMMTGPLNFIYGKQAVYFFNPADFAKIDRKKFSAVYFIIPDNKLDFYKSSDLFEKLIPIKDYTIQTNLLDIATGKKQDLYDTPLEFPENKNVTVTGKIYLLK